MRARTAQTPSSVKVLMNSGVASPASASCVCSYCSSSWSFDASAMSAVHREFGVSKSLLQRQGDTHWYHCRNAPQTRRTRGQRRRERRGRAGGRRARRARRRPCGRGRRGRRCGGRRRQTCWLDEVVGEVAENETAFFPRHALAVFGTEVGPEIPPLH